MYWLKEILWFDDFSLEAEVIITDGHYDLRCFTYPLELKKGDLLNFYIMIFNSKNVVRTYEKEYFVEKLHGPFDYNLTGELINRKEGIVKIGEIYLEGLDKIPGDIIEGDFVSFECWRLDLN